MAVDVRVDLGDQRRARGVHVAGLQLDDRRHGVDIEVVINPDGSIWTAYPAGGQGVTRNDEHGDPQPLDEQPGQPASASKSARPAAGQPWVDGGDLLDQVRPATPCLGSARRPPPRPRRPRPRRPRCPGTSPTSFFPADPVTAAYLREQAAQVE